jgi:hypothetical protein
MVLASLVWQPQWSRGQSEVQNMHLGLREGVRPFKPKLNYAFRF